MVRFGEGGAATRRSGADLTTVDDLLRPALELAVELARVGEQAHPPLPAPAPLRRYLQFAKLPARALGGIRRVLDEDEAFRARLAAVVDGDEIGQAGRLFLERPDGWEEELALLVDTASEEEAAALEDRAERSAQKQLARSQAAAKRAAGEAEGHRRAADQARADLAAERSQRREVDEELAAVRARLDDTEARRAAAVRRVKELEGQLAARAAEARERRAELDALRRELADARAALAAAAIAEPVAVPEVAAAEVAVPVPDGRDAALAAEVGAAADAAAALADALARAAARLRPTPEPPVPAAALSAAEPSPRRARRRPAALPGGVFEDDVAAAEHLVRLPGAVLLVDGYNVTKTAWPDVPIPDQRRRLVDALCELTARTGAEADVVFDGVDEPGGSTPHRLPAGVRVRFSPEAVEADDVVVALVDEHPLGRPVVVVSSDRRVREGARRRGANVLSSDQFLGALRR